MLVTYVNEFNIQYVTFLSVTYLSDTGAFTKTIVKRLHGHSAGQYYWAIFLGKINLRFSFWMMSKIAIT